MLLDAMRFVANPKEKTPAHITVRGPYSQRINVKGLQRKIQGTRALADGVEAFFGEDQNTVFIRCHSDEIRAVWKKRDFGFNPHITIYNGPSREFAGMLLRQLGDLAIRFDFVVGELLAMESTKGQFETFLKQSFNEKIISELAGDKISVSKIELLPAEDRISLVKKIARMLPKDAHITVQCR